MEFIQKNLGVIVCEHIFKAEKPVLYVVHRENSWQFLCGGENESVDDAKMVGIGHLIDRDPTLNHLADLPIGWDAERTTINDGWIKYESDDK